MRLRVRGLVRLLLWLAFAAFCEVTRTQAFVDFTFRGVVDAQYLDDWSKDSPMYLDYHFLVVVVGFLGQSS